MMLKLQRDSSTSEAAIMQSPAHGDAFTTSFGSKKAFCAQLHNSSCSRRSLPDGACELLSQLVEGLLHRHAVGFSSFHAVVWYVKRDGEREGMQSVVSVLKFGYRQP